MLWYIYMCVWENVFIHVCVCVCVFCACVYAFFPFSEYVFINITASYKNIYIFSRL